MKPKVVFFTESMSIMGGMERVIEFLTSSLANDFDVSILTMDGIHTQDFQLQCPIYSLHISVKPTNYWNKIKRYLITIIKLKNFLRQNPEISYFIANSPALSCSTMLTNKLFRLPSVKMIAFEHNTFNFPGKFWQLIRRYTFPSCYKVIALTKDAHKEYISIKCNSVHIPNAVSIEALKVSDLSNKKLVAVGRLAYQKGFDLLLPAWKKVVDVHPDWHLEIVGDGEDKEDLLKLLEELNLNNNVIFSGKTNNVQQKYLEASGFILSSRYEGFCLVLIEAMAHGLPCISFQCPSGPDEVITNNKNGYLATPENIDDLADKINKYIELPMQEKLKFSTESQSVAQNYLPEKIIKKWKEEVFND